MKLMIQLEIPTILFARITNGKKSKPHKFIYCGVLEVESYDTAANNSRPFGVKFRTLEIPREIVPELQDLIIWWPSKESSFEEAEHLAFAQPVNR